MGTSAKVTRWVPGSNAEGGDAILSAMGRGGMFLLVDELFNDVVRALGHDPVEVMREAYNTHCETEA